MEWGISGDCLQRSLGSIAAVTQTEKLQALRPAFSLA
jgi:hypothetical protein